MDGTMNCTCMRLEYYSPGFFGMLFYCKLKMGLG